MKDFTQDKQDEMSSNRKSTCALPVPLACFLNNIVIRYNLVFFLSGGGKFNYQGTKRWLEENLDNPGIAKHTELNIINTYQEPIKMGSCTYTTFSCGP